MSLNIYTVSVIALFLMLILPIVLVLILKKQKALKIIAIVFSCVYGFLLIVGTTADISISKSTISVSYHFANWFSMVFHFWRPDLLHTVLNLAMLFPIGFVVFVFDFKHPFLNTILICLAVSLAIELYQWILPVNRCTEVSDLFFNTLSGIISGSFCCLLKKFGAFNCEPTNKIDKKK